MSDLEALIPQAVGLVIDGEPLAIKPLKVGQMPAFLRAITPVMQRLPAASCAPTSTARKPPPPRRFPKIRPTITSRMIQPAMPPTVAAGPKCGGSNGRHWPWVASSSSSSASGVPARTVTTSSLGS